MFCFNKDVELDVLTLQKMINKFYTDVIPKLNKYKDYYDGIQDILQKSYSDQSKPCHRVITNYCKNIADSYCGYIATPGYISYRNADSNIEEIMDILKYNDYQTEDADFLLDALVYGVACELMYLDGEGKTRFRLINPTTCFGIYDDSLTNDLMYFVRIYKANDWDNTDTHNVDVYSNYDVKHYTMSGHNGNLHFVGEERHYFSQCPANIFMLQDEKSVFECVMSLQDAYNELLSDEIDDYSAFCDAYLTLTGVDADEDQIASMKENRVLVLPEGASASWLTKQSADVETENLKKRLHDSIYRISACVDFLSENFLGGVSSGIAIRYRLTGMETRAGKISASMKKALQRRIEIICGIASLKYGEGTFQDFEIDFKRNVPEDVLTTINMVNSLKGTVSDATLLGQLDFIPDVNKELELVQEQRKENMSLYSFGNFNEDDE